MTAKKKRTTFKEPKSRLGKKKLQSIKEHLPHFGTKSLNLAKQHLSRTLQFRDSLKDDSSYQHLHLLLAKSLTIILKKDFITFRDNWEHICSKLAPLLHDTHEENRALARHLLCAYWSEEKAASQQKTNAVSRQVSSLKILECLAVHLLKILLHHDLKTREDIVITLSAFQEHLDAASLTFLVACLDSFHGASSSLPNRLEAVVRRFVLANAFLDDGTTEMLTNAFNKVLSQVMPSFHTHKRLIMYFQLVKIIHEIVLYLINSNDSSIYEGIDQNEISALVDPLMACLKAPSFSEKFSLGTVVSAQRNLFHEKLTQKKSCYQLFTTSLIKILVDDLNANRGVEYMNTTEKHADTFSATDGPNKETKNLQGKKRYFCKQTEATSHHVSKLTLLHSKNRKKLLLMFRIELILLISNISFLTQTVFGKSTYFGMTGSTVFYSKSIIRELLHGVYPHIFTLDNVYRDCEFLVNRVNIGCHSVMCYSELIFTVTNRFLQFISSEIEESADALTATDAIVLVILYFKSLDLILSTFNDNLLATLRCIRAVCLSLENLDHIHHILQLIYYRFYASCNHFSLHETETKSVHLFDQAMTALESLDNAADFRTHFTKAHKILDHSQNELELTNFRWNLFAEYSKEGMYLDNGQHLTNLKDLEEELFSHREKMSLFLWRTTVKFIFVLWNMIMQAMRLNKDPPLTEALDIPAQNSATLSYDFNIDVYDHSPVLRMLKFASSGKCKEQNDMLKRMILKKFFCQCATWYLHMFTGNTLPQIDPLQRIFRTSINMSCAQCHLCSIRKTPHPMSSLLYQNSQFQKIIHDRTYDHYLNSFVCMWKQNTTEIAQRIFKAKSHQCAFIQCLQQNLLTYILLHETELPLQTMNASTECLRKLVEI